MPKVPQRIRNEHLKMAIKFTDVSPKLDLPSWSSVHETTVVEVSPLAYEQALAHLNHQSIEQGGLLIGRAWANPLPSDTGQVARVEILEAIASINSEATEYSLKMNTTVWDTANKRITELAEPHLRIVGWFHSHPNLGAFFSSTDKATQAAFFNHPYSVGWVIDPFTSDPARHQAFFIGAHSSTHVVIAFSS
jgi:proteasome lid subunit RPN8/RPN11